jgi:hypothetical protein
VPSGRAINPVTKTNWEGTGVKPDVEVPAEQALETALRKAREKLGPETTPRGAEPVRNPEKAPKDPPPAIPGVGQHPARFGLTFLMLLKQPSVQEELKLTKDQVTVVQDAAAKEMKAFNDLFPLGPDEHARRMKELSKENDQLAAKVLNPGQMKRLRQISLQVQGPHGFTDPQVAKELRLTEEQNGQIGKLIADADQQMGQLFQPGSTPEKVHQQMAELNKNSSAKILSLLTAAQQDKWKDLTGEPFRGRVGQGMPGIRRVPIAP